MRIRLSTAIFLTVGLFGLTSCSRSPEQKQRKYMDAGKRLMEKRDYARAALELRNAVSISPEAAEPHYQLALSLVGLSQFPEAVAELRKASEIDANHSGARLKLAELMLASGDSKLNHEAEAMIGRILGERPADRDALFMMAASQIQSGKLDDAEKYLEQSLEEFPSELRSAVALARIKVGANDLAGAEAILKKAAALNAMSVEPMIALGVFYVAVNRLPEAEAAYRKALQLDPDNSSALFEYAKLQAYTGDQDGAERTFRKLSDNPRKDLRSALGTYLCQVGKLDACIAEFQRLFELDPNDRQTRSLLVAAYLKANRLSEAEISLNRVIRRNPADGEALAQRSRIHIYHQRIRQAQEDLNALLALRPDSAEAHYLLAIVRERQGDVFQQRQELARTIQLDPRMIEARIAYVELLIKTGQPAAALDSIREAPAAQQHDVTLNSLRNWALIRSGSFAEPRRDIDRALAVSKTPELLFQDAVLKVAARDYQQALISLEDIVKKYPEDVRALKAIGVVCEAQKQPMLASRKIQFYGAQRANSAVVQLFVGTWLMEHGDRPAARAALEFAAKANPSVAGLGVALARIDLAEGKTDDARRRLTSALALQPGDASSLLLLASTEEGLGNHEVAAQHYLTVLKSDPNSVPALNNLAYLYSKRQAKLDDALRYAMKAKQLAPDNADVVDTLGWILYRKRLYRQALAEFSITAGKDKRPPVRYHLGLTYLKLGDSSKGQELVYSALKEEPQLSNDGEFER